MTNIDLNMSLLFQLVGLDKCFVAPRMVALVVADVFMLGLDMVVKGADTSKDLATFITGVIIQDSLQGEKSLLKLGFYYSDIQLM